MKFIKLLIASGLIICCSIITDANAAEPSMVFGGNEVLTDEQLELAEKQALKAAQANRSQTRMDEFVEDWRKVGSVVSNETPINQVFNQLSGGYKYGNGGGGMYWGQSTQTCGTVTVGGSIGGKYASVSLSYAPGSRFDSSGQFKICPQSLWYNHVKLYTSKNYLITKYNVYRKNKYDSGDGVFVRSENVATEYSIQWYWRTV